MEAQDGDGDGRKQLEDSIKINFRSIVIKTLSSNGPRMNLSLAIEFRSPKEAHTFAQKLLEKESNSFVRSLSRSLTKD